MLRKHIHIHICPPVPHSVCVCVYSFLPNASMHECEWKEGNHPSHIYPHEGSGPESRLLGKPFLLPD